MTTIIDEERAEDIMEFVMDNILKDTEVLTDEHGGYSDLSAYFKHTRVNHSIRFMGENGENTNIVESYFSRFRRLLRGQVHQIGAEFLYLYAHEIAYREDTRRWDNRRITRDMLSRMLSLEDNDKKPRFRGYWGQASRSNGGSFLGLVV